jgi:hypothetical protein
MCCQLHNLCLLPVPLDASNDPNFVENFTFDVVDGPEMSSGFEVLAKSCVGSYGYSSLLFCALDAC